MLNTDCFSDFTVKFVDVESKEQTLFSGHEAPVLSVALHPDEQMIVSRITLLSVIDVQNTSLSVASGQLKTSILCEFIAPLTSFVIVYY